MSETNLQTLLTRMIAADGPMPVSTFMALALGHPEHGYYITRDPLGAGGDFTTAPEISQVFGELLGLWTAQVWIDLGRPKRARLIELGPGRGTLMADALRAMALVPGLKDGLSLHLVETSPTLRAAQAKTLAASGLTANWHDTLGAALSAGEGPVLLLANEFFDALPIRQFVRTQSGWQERLVGTDEAGALSFVLSPQALRTAAILPAALDSAPEGAIAERCPAGEAIAAEIGAALAAHGGAALLVDYGHGKSHWGETLQALRSHAPAPVLSDPGAADITAHVDFEALALSATGAGAHAFGPLSQQELLARLGIEARAQALASNADALKGIARLVEPDQMGVLFKALALAAPGLTPPGFEAATRWPQTPGTAAPAPLRPA